MHSAKTQVTQPLHLLGLRRGSPAQHNGFGSLSSRTSKSQSHLTASLQHTGAQSKPGATHKTCSSYHSMHNLVTCKGFGPHALTSDSSVIKQVSQAPILPTRRYLHHTGIQPTPTDIDRKGVKEGAAHTCSYAKRDTWGQQMNSFTPWES